VTQTVLSPEIRGCGVVRTNVSGDGLKDHTNT
jgi:hypothetical protein